MPRNFMGSPSGLTPAIAGLTLAQLKRLSPGKTPMLPASHDGSKRLEAPNTGGGVN
jgi:hypothetical protein